MLDRAEGRLSTSLALIAGYVDGYGIVALGVYVSFMSGNTTQTGTQTGQGHFAAALRIASPIGLMHELIRRNPRNAERIFPYIGGEEVNDDPTHSHHRYVINFEDFPRERDEAFRSWFDCSDNQR